MCHHIANQRQSFATAVAHERMLSTVATTHRKQRTHESCRVCTALAVGSLLSLCNPRVNSHNGREFFRTRTRLSPRDASLSTSSAAHARHDVARCESNTPGWSPRIAKCGQPRTIKTGQVAARMTWYVVEPNTSRSMGLRPWTPITIKSACSSADRCSTRRYAPPSTTAVSTVA